MRAAAVVIALFAAFLVASAEIDDRRTVAVLFKQPTQWIAVNAKPTGSEELHFVVALQQRNLEQLEKLYWDRTNPESRNWRNWMTTVEINALVNPSAQVHNAVLEWLQQSGVSSIVSYGDSFHCVASVKTLSAMFSTEFHMFEHAKTGQRIPRAYGRVSVPAALVQMIVMVEGLTHFPVERSVIRTPEGRRQNLIKSADEKRQIDPLDWDGYIVPQTVWNQYDIPWDTKVQGSNVTQGVVEWEQQFFSPSDLTSFGKKFGIPVINPPTVVGKGTGEGSPEGSLDIQWISAIGMNAKNTYWMNDGSNTWLYGWSNKFLAAATVPYVNSISYAWNEEDQCAQGIGYQECMKLNVTSTGYAAVVNVQFQKIGLRGVTLTVASGDSGANGRTDENCSENHFNPDFPSCSPFVTSVGATELRDVTYLFVGAPEGCRLEERFCVARGYEENAVSNGFSGFASGGGFSNVAATPAFQTSFVQQYFKTSEGQSAPKGYFNSSGRGYPDIAAVGETMIMIVDDGQSQAVGGTSASSPIVAGVFTLLNDYVLSKSGKPLGPMNQLLYQMAVKQPTAFTDITSGNNACTEQGCSHNCKGFTAAVGWDPVTGLGSPVYSEMLAYIQTIV